MNARLAGLTSHLKSSSSWYKTSKKFGIKRYFKNEGNKRGIKREEDDSQEELQTDGRSNDSDRMKERM